MADSHSIAETWKPIPDSDGYEASSLGRVRSPWRILRPALTGGRAKNKIQYLQVSIYAGGVRHSRRVNRLVLMAFTGPPPTPKHHAAHWDGNSLNNAAGNLRWATATENYTDTASLGRGVMGERIGNAKLTDESALEIRRAYRPPAYWCGPSNARELCARFGICKSTLHSLLERKTWKHVGPFSKETTQ